MLINAVQGICKYPVKSQLTIIAKKVYDKYPNTITDHLNGLVIGTGYETLIRQLVNRSENVNRECPTPLRRRRGDLEDDADASTSAVNAKDSYGCINWQPSVDEGREEMERKREDMQGVSVAERKDYNPETALQVTFSLQRFDINNNKPMDEMVSTWPFLFTENGMLCHFQLLTGKDVKEKMTTAFRERSSRIMAYSQHGVKSAKVARACKEVMRDLAIAGEITGNDRPSLLAVMKLLLMNFDDEEAELFQIVDFIIIFWEHTTPSEVNLHESPPSPFLVICGDTLLLASRLMLVVDKIVVIPNINSGLSGLTLLFAAFYCFNVEYPESASATLEFIQRCFVGINPEKGSKAVQSKKRKTSSMNAKVLGLVNAVSDFEWVQTGLD